MLERQEVAGILGNMRKYQGAKVIVTGDFVDEKIAKGSREKFLSLAGDIDLDEQAVKVLREGSRI